MGNTDKILAKIRKDHEDALLEAKDTLQKHPEDIKKDIKSEKEQVAKGLGKGGKGDSLPIIEYVRPPGVLGHEPSDPDTKEKRAKVKEVRGLIISFLFGLNAVRFSQQREAKCMLGMRLCVDIT